LTSQFEEFMSVEISISGLKELQAQLDALPTKLAKRVLRPALEDAGAIIQQAAGINAPRESGFLTTHIGLKVVVHNDLSASVKVGPDKSAFWGIFSELGTAPHEETSKDGKTWMHPGEPARPWLRPALASSADGATKAMVDIINDGLKDVSK
jgi:HK97 gp10 family phage protein